MKKGAIILAALLILSLIPVAYAKQEDSPGKALGLQKNVKQNRNEEGAIKVDWATTTSAVQSFDKACKLIVNRPNGHVITTITGIMRGLKPSTMYTACIIDGHTISTGWSMTGTWTRNVVYSGTTYTHSYTTTQSGNTYTGTGRKPATGTIEATESVTGTITGNHLTFKSTYLTGDPGYIQDAVGTIAQDGSITGTWTDNDSRSGTWTAPAGSAKPTGTTPSTNSLTAPTVSFKTNPVGNANFHINLHRNDFGSDGEHNISLLIKEGEHAIQISDPIFLNVHSK
ncbi:MAG: hypothetical protein NTY03_03220 [Candidatus Bathyarchaeota archaeon]|nr:hypothetical protein [Candidatus Bathyarchaeota archaeon]